MTHSVYLRCFADSLQTLLPTYWKKLSYEHLKVFASLNQVSAGLNQFKSHVWQKQVFAGRNPSLVLDACDHICFCSSNFNEFHLRRYLTETAVLEVLDGVYTVGWCQWASYRKPPTLDLMVTWPMMSHDPKWWHYNAVAKVVSFDQQRF